jgi:hypothetical protein
MYDEFERYRKEIRHIIEKYNELIKPIKASLGQDDLEKWNECMSTLEHIEHHWAEWDIKLARRDLKYSNPSNWVEDKQAWYDSQKAMNKILRQGENTQ